MLNRELLVCDSWCYVGFYNFVLSTKFGLVFILWWCRDWVYFCKRIHQTLSAENSFTSSTLMTCASILQPPSVTHLKSQSQLWAQSSVLVQSHHKHQSPQDCFSTNLVSAFFMASLFLLCWHMLYDFKHTLSSSCFCPCVLLICTKFPRTWITRTFSLY